MWMEILVYLGIFVAKMVEVTLSTLRNVLVNRGEKVKGALIGFFEAMIWVIVVSNVLSSVAQDPLKVVVYCLAFSVGNYLGVIIEGKLAFGTANIIAVVANDAECEMSVTLREMGFGVTILRGEGMEKEVDVLMIYLKRRLVPEAIELIRQKDPNAMVTVNDVRQLSKGFIRK